MSFSKSVLLFLVLLLGTTVILWFFLEKGKIDTPYCLIVNQKKESGNYTLLCQPPLFSDKTISLTFNPELSSAFNFVAPLVLWFSLAIFILTKNIWHGAVVCLTAYFFKIKPTLDYPEAYSCSLFVYFLWLLLYGTIKIAGSDCSFPFLGTIMVTAGSLLVLKIQAEDWVAKKKTKRILKRTFGEPGF